MVTKTSTIKGKRGTSVTAESKVKIPAVDRLHDTRVDCHSTMTAMQVQEYLEMVEAAYANRGGIDGQRDKLRTTSAIRIRRRMVEDISRGAVLPPVVVGIVLPTNEFKNVDTMTAADVRKIAGQIEADRISIIDGMQRTTALREAISTEPSVKLRMMRVEFWISESTNSLIYRMLVLNTGQVPWNLRSQVEIVFRSLIVEIEGAVPDLEVLKLTDERRRSKGGQFQANELVELFLVFGARKEKIDIRERLADEFTRLDFIEAASDADFAKNFRLTLDILVRVDLIFDRYKAGKKENTARFHNGKDLFASQPACVGLVTAVASEVFGRPGVNRPQELQAPRLEKIRKGVKKLETRLKKLNNEDLGLFLGFQTLNETISRGRSGLSVGDMEREFFLKAFQVLIEEDFALADLTPCWRAY